MPPQRTSIGLIGVGRMGLPVLERLVSAGYQVVAADTDAARRDLALAAGATLAASGREVAASVGVLITVLPGPAELEGELLGGTLDAVPAGALWIDLTSNDPLVAERLAAAAAARNVSVVAAGMGGGVDAARAGSLIFYVGAASDALARARPVLEVLGERIEHVGERPADGSTAKLLANLLWFGQAVAVSEALLLAQARGLDPERMRGVLARSAGGSVFLDEFAGSLLDGDYLESFGIDRVVEELDALEALAAAERSPFELSGLVARLHREALGEFGAVGGELLAARLLEHRAGRRLRRQ